MFPRGREESHVVPGRYPLLAIVSVGYRRTIGSTPSPATRVTQLVHLIKGSSPFRIRDLERLAAVSAQVNVEWLIGTEQRDFTDLLRRLAKTQSARPIEPQRPA